MEMFKVFFLEDFVHMGLKDTNLAIRALFLTIDTLHIMQVKNLALQNNLVFTL